MADTIRNPAEWTADSLESAAQHLTSIGSAVRGEAAGERRFPEVRRITVGDLREVLARGIADMAANRSDVISICLVYPLAGLLLAWFAFDYDLLPLLFPAASGFALLGPVAAVGLYEMSRRREQGIEVSWADAFGVVRSPSFGSILVLGVVLLTIFLAWMAAANAIYGATLGPEPPASAAAFAGDVVGTPAGWAMILVGGGVGFLFAAGVLAISLVSFPLLLDRRVGVIVAVWTSLRVVIVNPVPAAAWGGIVAAGLALGSIPLFLGLIVVLPVLGHGTWHLYRRTVVADADRSPPA